MEVLFASSPVANLDAAIEWYERFFGRAADIIPNDEEAMWSVTDNGWLYDFIAALADRGIGAGPIEVVGDDGMKSNVRDPDGNVLSLIQVASAS